MPGCHRTGSIAVEIANFIHDAPAGGTFFSTATGIARNRGSTLHKEVVLAQPLQVGNTGLYAMIFFHGIMGLALGRQKYEKKQ